MKFLSIKELNNLIEKPDGVCVSIYMPTHRLGTETQQDPIRFKNLMRSAESQLIESGLRPQDARDLLAPAHQIDKYKFWQHQSDGVSAQ